MQAEFQFFEKLLLRIAPGRKPSRAAGGSLLLEFFLRFDNQCLGDRFTLGDHLTDQLK